MSALSRRALFGLFASAAAAPLVKAAQPDLWLGSTPIYYDRQPDGVVYRATYTFYPARLWTERGMETFYG